MPGTAEGSSWGCGSRFPGKRPCSGAGCPAAAVVAVVVVASAVVAAHFLLVPVSGWLRSWPAVCSAVSFAKRDKEMEKNTEERVEEIFTGAEAEEVGDKRGTEEMRKR